MSMKRLWLVLASVCAVAASAAFFACDSEDKKEYEATVAWQIAGTPTCSSPGLINQGNAVLQFDEVVVKVYEDKEDVADPAAETVVEPLRAQCAQLEYVVRKLRRGTYWVVLEAMADFDGERLPYYKGGGELTVPTDEKLTIQLTMAKGSVEVGWGFERSYCTGNAVTEVSASLTLQGSTQSITSGLIPCTDEIYLFANLDWGLYSLVVEGYDAAGAVTHRGEYEAPNIIPEQDTATDTGVADPDGGVAEAPQPAPAPEAPVELNVLDVRPGKDILSNEAYVVLMPITM
jgi:hypothetical protein